jgi:hypothetical protein
MENANWPDAPAQKYADPTTRTKKNLSVRYLLSLGARDIIKHLEQPTRKEKSELPIFTER